MFVYITFCVPLQTPVPFPSRSRLNLAEHTGGESDRGERRQAKPNSFCPICGERYPNRLLKEVDHDEEEF